MTQSGSITVRGIEIGRGIPKICVPILGRTREDILTSADQAISSNPDIVEWRIDWFDALSDLQECQSVLNDIRKKINNIPLLLTFRSKQEGGERDLVVSEYTSLLISMISTGLVDLVDVELFSGAECTAQIIDAAHSRGVFVIGSSHDFARTPDEFTLLNRLELMQVMGCDIAKIAVMPQTSRDVITLLSVTVQMKQRHPEIPIITMSMGSLGIVSRLSGEVFGSALTFGSAGQASAPGQVPVDQLREILTLLHQ